MKLHRIFKNCSKISERYTQRTEHFCNDLYTKDSFSGKEKFEYILSFAEEIINTPIDIGVKEHPILDFIRIIGRRLQSDYMSYLLYSGKDTNELRDLEPREVLFSMYNSILDENNNYIEIDKLIEIQYNKRKINLSKDLILPWPWHRKRIKDAILNIGKGRPFGEWKQDYGNHWVNVWLPMGIAWVGGGNHSIAVGIVQGGELEPEYYSDISKLYKYIRCDGEKFVEINTGNILAKVHSPEFAAIYEIGRMMVDKGISFIN